MFVVASVGLPTTGLASSAKRSAPFSVGPVPAGFELLTAGIGTKGQDWGDDSFGTDEPFTVLASASDKAPTRRTVVVSITGYRGYEGGLDQASAGYVAPETQRIKVDGRDAVYSPADPERADWGWADLVVDRGNDIAVRATSPNASRQELIDLERRVRISGDHRRAPQIPDPPDGLRVVGSVDVDAVLALSSWVTANEPDIPGASSSYGIGWTAGEGHGLAVMTVRNRAGTLDALRALPALPEWQSYLVRPVRVDGRNGVVVEQKSDEGHYRAVALESSWGDLVVVTAMRDNVPSEDQLVEVARSVRRVDQQAWTQFVEQATANTPLAADPDAIELARGSVGDVEWLFQARPSSNVVGSSVANGPGDVIVADPCLKLSNRHRVCAESGSQQGATESIQYSSGTRGTESELPPFVVVTSRIEGSSLRIQTKAGIGTGPLYELPDGQWAGLVFVNGGALAGCAPYTADTPASFMRVDVLDASDNEIACLGLQPPT